jgi:uncharacterized protein YdaT
MSERDLTSEEIEALEELADLSERDPDLYRQIVSEGFAEAERQEHGEALLGMFENATQRRQEQDQEFLEVLHRAHQAQVEKAEQE